MTKQSPPDLDRRIYESVFTHQPAYGFRPPLPPDILKGGESYVTTELSECLLDPAFAWRDKDTGETVAAILRHAQRLVEQHPPYVLYLNDHPLSPYQNFNCRYNGQVYAGVVVKLLDDGTVYVNWLGASTDDDEAQVVHIDLDQQLSPTHPAVTALLPIGTPTVEQMIALSRLADGDDLTARAAEYVLALIEHDQLRQAWQGVMSWA